MAERRATRVRQLATPSWLSLRPSGWSSGERRPIHAAPEAVATTFGTNSEPATTAGSHRFFSLALSAGAVSKYDDLTDAQRVRRHRGGDTPPMWATGRSAHDSCVK